MMRDTRIRFEQLAGRRLAATVALAFALLLAGYAQLCRAEQPNKETFTSAEKASQALYLAVQNDNEEAITRILGADRELVFSDDAAQDKVERERFIQKYREMHRLVREPDATVVLHIGAENWPFPVPIEARNGGWQFDAEAGMAEVLFRRIGENEETAIQGCHALATAEKERKRSDGDPSIRSIRALLVNAGDNGPVVPFQGYYFRSLGSQGKPAASQTSNRKTSASRFAFVAYPADYRSTGVMTYLINQDGVVYEKDLGPNTVQLAKAMTRYQRDSTWHPAE